MPRKVRENRHQGGAGPLSEIDWEQLAREADFSPSAMADLCPISLRQMERFFFDHFASTPTEWVRHFRCRLARQLILQGWSSKAVVAELHFADHAHLCHDFSHVPLHDNPGENYPDNPEEVGGAYRDNLGAG